TIKNLTLRIIGPSSWDANDGSAWIDEVNIYPTTVVPVSLTAKPVGDFLRSGNVAGNEGDYFVNADGGHTLVNWIWGETNPDFAGYQGHYCDHPQVTQSETDENDGMTVLNSSTDGGVLDIMTCSYRDGMVGKYYPPNPRILWRPEASGKAQFSTGMLANEPVTRGYSASEIDELKKTFFLLAGFRPDVKHILNLRGLLVPVTWMVYRRSLVDSDEEYLTPKAHPWVWDNDDAVLYDQALFMAEYAYSITPATLPPIVEVYVSGYHGVNGKDFFTRGTPLSDREDAWNTPATVARWFRGRQQNKTVIADATRSYDINGRPITYHWIVLYGDAQITPLNEEKSKVRISYEYAQGFNNMAVIGVFVHNGAYYSAPCYISNYVFPAPEQRYYDPAGRVSAIDYVPLNQWRTGLGWIYQDTFKAFCATEAEDPYGIVAYGREHYWTRDEFHYGLDGKEMGWTRVFDGKTWGFTPEGYLVISKSADGLVQKAQRVKYNNNYTQKAYFTTWEKIGPEFSYSTGHGPVRFTSTLGMLTVPAGAVTRHPFTVAYNPGSGAVNVRLVPTNPGSAAPNPQEWGGIIGVSAMPQTYEVVCAPREED
ncbi:MAG: hypothetical protein ACWGQW_15910, partial [bacterium]